MCGGGVVRCCPPNKWVLKTTRWPTQLVAQRRSTRAVARAHAPLIQVSNGPVAAALRGGTVCGGGVVRCCPFNKWVKPPGGPRNWWPNAAASGPLQGHMPP